MPNPRQRTKKKADSLSVDHDYVTLKRGIASENLLIFRIAGETFGLPLATVAEITRLPELAHMPLVPRCLLGLANLRGFVLPVISLRVLLQLPDLEANEQSRVVVLRGDAPVGFVVDQVERLMEIAPDQFQPDEAGAGTTDPTLLDCVIKGAEGQSTIKILSPPRLLAGQFTQLGVPAARPASRPPVTTHGSAVAPARALVSLLSLSLGQQEYALPLDRVREIIPLPDYIAELPRPETAVLGVMTLQDRLLPIVSLRALLGLPVVGELQQRSKIVVVSLGNGVVGVVADGTREILRIDPDNIDPAPALLTRGEGEAEISSICRVDNGRRLIALLSPDQLFRPDLVRRILADQGIANEPQSQPETSAMAHEQFIIFRLGKQDYGIPIAVVAEIARPPEDITQLPKAPDFIDGVMNLRGSVVPIINLRRRFDLGTAEHAASQRILILAVGGVTAGFVVDSVSEIMKAPVDAIHPAPEVSQEQMRLISKVINLEADGRLILLVDPTQLLDKIEADVLAKFERSALDPPVTAP
jgi:purine-binding chemotaxis protein CheW